MGSRRVVTRARVATGAGALGSALCLGWLLASGETQIATSLGIVLLLLAVVANLTSAIWEGPMLISGSFVPVMLAVAYLGPAPAVFIAIVSEFAFWVVDRYRPAALGINVLSSGAPTLCGALIFQAADLSTSAAGFYLLIGCLSAAQLAMNIGIVTVLSAWLHGDSVGLRFRTHSKLVPALLINVVLTVAVVGTYDQVGLGAVVFVRDPWRILPLLD